MDANPDQCAVPGCTTSRGPGVHPFPKVLYYCNKWKSVIRNEAINRLDFETLNKNYFVCDEHFMLDSYELRSSSQLILKDDAVPTKCLGANRKYPEGEIPNEMNVIFPNTNQCAVPGCPGTRIQGAHPFPKSPYYCSVWKSAIQNEMISELDPETLSRTYFLCARHFMLDAYQFDKQTLKEDAVPTVCLGSKREFRNGAIPNQRNGINKSINKNGVPGRGLRSRVNKEYPRILTNVIEQSTNQCAVPGCPVNRGPGVYPFPRDLYYCDKWKTAIRNNAINKLKPETLHNYFICARHFTTKDHELGTTQLILKAEAVPKLHLKN